MKYAVQLVPQGVIPRDPKIAVQLRKLPKVEPVEIVVATPEPEPEPPAVEPLPAGTDVWYDSPDIAVIPFRQIDNETCPDTPNAGFGVDDAIDFEGDYLTGGRSAWWMLVVPEGVTDAVLTADTWRTIKAPGAANEPDTVLHVVITDEDLPPLAPLPTATSDFSTMYVGSNFSDDDPEPGGDNSALSKLVVPLFENTVHWIRVGIYNESSGIDPDYDAIYRLRLSLTFTPTP